MSRFDRYMLSQLLAVFGLFSLVMVMVYWVNRAVRLFDQLISDGQTASVFLEFTLLTLPNVIRLVLPVSAFAAAVHVTNRLHSESELTVMQATGFGPFRMARPVLAFGLIVALMVGALVNAILPLSLSMLSERRAEIAADVTARFLRDGQFRHPADGVTFYVREIGPGGEMRDALLVDAADPAREMTYSARRAFLVREDGAPFLQMFDGSVQVLDRAQGTLSHGQFQRTSYALENTIDLGAVERRRIDELSTLELLRPTPALTDEVRRGAALLIVEGHQRISQSTLSVVAPLLGFSILLLGGFSRFGLWRQVLAAVLAIIVVKLADTALVGVALADDRLWPLVYGGSALGGVGAVAVLWAAGRERRPRADAEVRA